MISTFSDVTFGPMDRFIVQSLKYYIVIFLADAASQGLLYAHFSFICLVSMIFQNMFLMQIPLNGYTY